MEITASNAQLNAMINKILEKRETDQAQQFWRTTGKVIAAATSIILLLGIANYFLIDRTPCVPRDFLEKYSCASHDPHSNRCISKELFFTVPYSGLHCPFADTIHRTQTAEDNLNALFKGTITIPNEWKDVFNVDGLIRVNYRDLIFRHSNDTMFTSEAMQNFTKCYGVQIEMLPDFESLDTWLDLKSSRLYANRAPYSTPLEPRIWSWMNYYVTPVC